MDSDGTLIIYFGELAGGTLRFCERFGRSVLTVDGAQTSIEAAAMAAIDFIAHHRIGVLNVAGPRATTERRGQVYAASVVKVVLNRMDGRRT